DDGKGLGEPEGEPCEAAGEVFSFEPLHHQEGLPVRGEPVRHMAHDRRVCEPGERARLLLEAVALALRPGGHDLHRDGLAPEAVGGPRMAPMPPLPETSESSKRSASRSPGFIAGERSGSGGRLVHEAERGRYGGPTGGYLALIPYRSSSRC